MNYLFDIFLSILMAQHLDQRVTGLIDKILKGCGERLSVKFQAKEKAGEMPENLAYSELGCMFLLGVLEQEPRTSLLIMLTDNRYKVRELAVQRISACMQSESIEIHKCVLCFHLILTPQIM
ncbi:hypothetical protein ALC56_08389 [Trachymyrmex septentrionalis]|uniref:Uncharacterized protein n=1 Tax=Trachymyrmex septentrionalis TaxID=34720 RepID=A0A151JUY0_9HYME|nr:hypothetical protein ALC56_08389 [Trachymyrmex septentrionalis]